MVMFSAAAGIIRRVTASMENKKVVYFFVLPSPYFNVLGN
jgi:hypothetical protein